mmetsp:Transcript_65448/g.206819  ORF Transcript_65448/g.206819 Transcript_65448/m.206819 type:complete len:657 (+) Transcript_65448:902-2872(+)
MLKYLSTRRMRSRRSISLSRDPARDPALEVPRDMEGALIRRLIRACRFCARRGSWSISDSLWRRASSAFLELVKDPTPAEKALEPAVSKPRLARDFLLVGSAPRSEYMKSPDCSLTSRWSWAYCAFLGVERRLKRLLSSASLERRRPIPPSAPPPLGVLVPVAGRFLSHEWSRKAGRLVRGEMLADQVAGCGDFIRAPPPLGVDIEWRAPDEGARGVPPTLQLPRLARGVGVLQVSVLNPGISCCFSPRPHATSSAISASPVELRREPCAHNTGSPFCLFSRSKVFFIFFSDMERRRGVNAPSAVQKVAVLRDVVVASLSTEATDPPPPPVRRKGIPAGNIPMAPGGEGETRMLSTELCRRARCSGVVPSADPSGRRGLAPTLPLLPPGRRCFGVEWRGVPATLPTTLPARDTLTCPASSQPACAPIPRPSRYCSLAPSTSRLLRRCPRSHSTGAPLGSASRARAAALSAFFLTAFSRSRRDLAAQTTSGLAAAMSHAFLRALTARRRATGSLRASSSSPILEGSPARSSKASARAGGMSGWCAAAARGLLPAPPASRPGLPWVDWRSSFTLSETPARPSSSESAARSASTSLSLVSRLVRASVATRSLRMSSSRMSSTDITLVSRRENAPEACRDGGPETGGALPPPARCAVLGL